LQPLKCQCKDILPKSNQSPSNFILTHGEKLIGEYYTSRREAEAVKQPGRINLTKLSTLFKIAENLNFLRHVFLKHEDTEPSKSLDLVDAMMSIFLLEITESVRMSEYEQEGQLLLALGIERMMSRVEEKVIEGTFDNMT
jgi:hypothetical protein